jgi:hypothetical protein
MTPAEQALQDQVTAATRQARNAMLATEREHIANGGGAPEPVLTALVDQLTAYLAAGRTRFCPHAIRSPQPLWWLPGRPSRVNCAPCTKAALGRPKAKQHQLRCAHCRQVRADVAGRMYQLPVLRVGERPVGPITIIFDLCLTCAAGDDDRPQATGSHAAAPAAGTDTSGKPPNANTNEEGARDGSH